MSDDLSTEVALVDETRSCRRCSWFWPDKDRALGPYGPFVRFDFAEAFPRAARSVLPILDQDQDWLAAKSAGAGYIDPAVLRGCRKAPIMTIGINPNVSGHYATPDAARYVYPGFERIADYAYYYRYRGINQEKVAGELPLTWAAEKRLVASSDGVVLQVERSKSHRFVAIRVRFDDGREETLEFAWNAGEAAAVFVQGGRPPSEGGQATQFRANQVLAAVVSSKAGTRLELSAAPASYYRRFDSVLKRLAELADWPRELRVGEDVSQGDMVACASPGWDKTTWDLPVDGIASNCAGDKRFMLRQLLQSQPRVIVLVGKNALRMFATYLRSEPWLQELIDRKFDTWSLFYELSQRPRYLQLTDGEIELNARILCAPHFSYDDNYAPGVRFSVTGWLEFKHSHPAAAEWLEGRGSVKPPAEDVVYIDFKPRKELDPNLSVESQRELAAHYVEPIEVLAAELLREVRNGNLQLDPQLAASAPTEQAPHGLLKRAPGTCNYCSNAKWKFEEGCLYANTLGNSVANAATRSFAQRLGQRIKTGQRPDSVRVWRGTKLPRLTAAQFATKLQAEFVPATIRLLRPIGLRAYLPTLLEEHDVQGLPHELALVFYADQATYTRSRQTSLGTVYGAFHSSAFSFEPSTSTSDFPTRWDRSAPVSGRPHYLIDALADWQSGCTEVLVAKLESAEALTRALQEIEKNPPSMLDGYIFVLHGEYFCRWAHFESKRSGALLAAEGGLSAPLHQSRSRDYEFKDFDAKEAPAKAPLERGVTLNVRFAPVES